MNRFKQKGKMKKFSEVKWSEVVRKIIKQRVEDLEKLEKNPKKESFLTMLATENVLRKDWLSSDEDELWKNL